MLTIASGGTVSNGVGRIGHHTGSSGRATVRGTGSTWTNSDFLIVANSGGGSLAIIDGGIVNNGDGLIGYNAGSTGDVTVRGTGATWDNEIDLHVGPLAIANSPEVAPEGQQRHWDQLDVL